MPQPVVRWHSSHCRVVWKWPFGLPVAETPLWQLEQAPVTAEWSNRTLLQLVVTWQSSQVFDEDTWPADLPMATRPSWQAAQLAEVSA